jgi:serine-type D-Ala-D-Ala carboxypeptidase/endopeptidase (penicillin-binding protein 4)
MALRAAIDSMVEAPEFRNAHWGILIVDPDRGDTLYSRNAGKLFMPASNQKLITGAVSLALLGAEYRYRTPVAVGAGPRPNGIASGDLVVFGSGDPSMSDAMRGDAFVFLQSFADSLRARGIEGFTGRVRSGRDAFPDAPLGFGWAWDDLDYPYSAGADELMLNEGFSSIIVRGNERAGLPALAQTKSMGGPGVRIDATTVAKPQGAPSVNRIQVTTAPELASDELHNVVIVRGTIAAGDTVTEEVAHRNVAGAFIDALRVALSTKTISQLQQPVAQGSPLDTVFTIVSPPLSEILKRMEKPSQNQIAELLYKTIALEKTGVGTADSARAVIERQLVAWGARSDGFAVRDGSGLSRHDYVTPATLVRVLDAMRRHADFRVFYDALPIAGVDGTIRNRMRGTPAEGNVHAKTGFVDKARSLSGYVTTADGRMLLFSFLANNWTTPTRAVERVQDAIAARLASMHLAR